MIAAMPAMGGVRGKNKGDGSIGFIGRPHKLSLHFRPPILQHQVTPTPSPVNSPPGTYQPHRERAHHRFARNFLSKRCIFQLSVLAPLVGVILLFIGLIQLTPGAEMSPYGIPLIIAGSAALLLGAVVILMRVYFTWELNRLHMRRDVPQIKVNEPSVTDPDLEKVGGGGPNDLSNSTTTTTNAVNGATGRKSSVVVTTNLGNNGTTTTISDDKSPIPSPKAPPRSKSKDRNKGKDKENKGLDEEEEASKRLLENGGDGNNDNVDDGKEKGGPDEIKGQTTKQV